MDLDYEQSYHKFELTNWWMKARRQIIFHYLEKFKAEIILDVGCSAGTMMEKLKAKGFSRVYGVDISESAIQECLKRKLNVFKESAEKTHFNGGFFDAIIASDVLEHTKSDSKTMEEWNRILKPGGHILLFVPAFMHLWSSSDEINHHRKRYGLFEITELSKKHGFVPKKTSYWNFTLYLPLLVVSRLRNLLEIRSANLKPVNPFLNAFLFMLLYLENVLIIAGIKFPFGVSCVSVLEKT